LNLAAPRSPTVNKTFKFTNKNYCLKTIMATSESIPRCKNLVLDSGPLLSLSPLRGLAATYLTVPQVLDELKDKRAREHFEQLGLSAGVKIEVRSPNAASLSYGMLYY